MEMSKVIIPLLDNNNQMKSTIIILICLTCFIKPGIGQNNKVDFLMRIIDCAKEDTTKVRTLNSLVSQLTYEKPETAVYFAGKAQALAVKY